MKHKQSGNALWFILLAIFLLGGLTVLLSRTGSQSEDTGSTERASIMASEMMRYAAGIESAVQQLLSRGCSENQISFHHPDLTPAGSYINPNSTDGSCNIFDVKGAGIAFTRKKDSWREETTASSPFWQLYGNQCIYGVGTGTTTCTNAQTELFVAAGVLKKELCLEINRRLGVENPSGAPPSDIMLGGYFTGSFEPSGSAGENIIGDSATTSAIPLQYKKSACLQDSNNQKYHFYHVILAR